MLRSAIHVSWDSLNRTHADLCEFPAGAGRRLPADVSFNLRSFP